MTRRVLTFGASDVDKLTLVCRQNGCITRAEVESLSELSWACAASTAGLSEVPDRVLREQVADRFSERGAPDRRSVEPSSRSDETPGAGSNRGMVTPALGHISGEAGA